MKRSVYLPPRSFNRRGTEKSTLAAARLHYLRWNVDLEYSAGADPNDLVLAHLSTGLACLCWRAPWPPSAGPPPASGRASLTTINYAYLVGSVVVSDRDAFRNGGWLIGPALVAKTFLPLADMERLPSTADHGNETAGRHLVDSFPQIVVVFGRILCRCSWMFRSYWWTTAA